MQLVRDVVRFCSGSLLDLTADSPVRSVKKSLTVSEILVDLTGDCPVGPLGSVVPMEQWV